MTFRKKKIPQKEELDIYSKKMDLLMQSVDRIYPKMGMLMFRSFIQGIFVGLGTTVGLAIISAILIFLVGGLKNVPIVGNLIEISHVSTYLPSSQKK